MDVSVVMTLFNRADLLRLTVKRYSQFQSAKNTELVVVDDCSTDGLELVLKEAAKVFGLVRWVRMDKRLSLIPVKANNPALGVNLAVKHATGEIIVKTDPECYPLTDVLGLAPTVASPRKFIFARCVRGTTALNDQLKSFVTRGISMPDERAIDAMGPGLWETKHFVSSATRWAYWFTSVFSRAVFMKAGGVDERFLSGFAGEDDEFAERMARNMGYADHLQAYDFVDTLSVVHLWHPAPSSGGKPFHGTELHERNKTLLWESRQLKTLLANKDHDWGSDKSVVGVEVVT